MSNDIRYGRKRNGIVRELKEKMEDWLGTISDKDVQDAARKDAIVTGGSIASMLLGEPVNDFDVYFRTIKTTKAVAEYYVNVFNEATKQNVTGSVVEGTAVPSVRTEPLKNCKGAIEDRVVIYIKSSGVAAEEQGTYDYFEMREPEATVGYIESLAGEVCEDKSKPKYRPIFLSQNAITLSNKVQLVTRFYGEPSEIHDNYDFVHAMCYWDNGFGRLELPAEALEALLSRTLVYRGSLYPVASIFRTKKFLERGWRITAGQQLKIMWQISELDMKDPYVMREQLTGVDMAYMHQLISALKDVAPEKINSAYISVLIDRIFD